MENELGKCKVKYEACGLNFELGREKKQHKNNNKEQTHERVI